MEKRVLLAFALSIAVFVIWSYFFGPEPKAPEPTTVPSEEIAKRAGERAAPVTRTAETEFPTRTTKPLPQETVYRSAKEVIVKTDLYTARFTETGGRLTSLTLDKYRLDTSPGSPPKELVTVESPQDFPLRTYFLADSVPGLGRAHFSADRETITVNSARQRQRLTFTHETKDGLEVIKVFTFHHDSYLIDLEVMLRNLSAETIDDNLVLELTSSAFKRKKRYSFAGLGLLVGDDLHEIKIDKIEKGLAKIKQGNYSLIWAGYEDQYFL
ncbi:MAG: membrane protein insertase YidC, partial [Deltaproteobacteria bacterium]|nr:membrane protein insertase YidC [Deltaproteobacteria bacterium]